MSEVTFESLLDAVIEAWDGWDDFVEEAVEALLEQIEDDD